MFRHLRSRVFSRKLYLWRNENLVGSATAGDALLTHRFRREDLDDRFRDYRDRQLLINRLDAGYTGYWFAYRDIFIHAHWYAEATYEVWDIRSALIIPEGSRYLFDVYTAREYRGRGVFRAALASSCADLFASQGGTIYALTDVRNTPANAAFTNAGFDGCASIAFWQLPPFRFHVIEKVEYTQHHVSLMRLRNPMCTIDLTDIRIDGKI